MSRGPAAWSLCWVLASALPGRPASVSPPDKRGVSRGVSMVLPAPGLCRASPCPGDGRTWTAMAGSTGTAGGKLGPGHGRTADPWEMGWKTRPWPAHHYHLGQNKVSFTPMLICNKYSMDSLL